MNQEEINFWKEVEELILPSKEINIEFRLYYDELGEIYSCYMVDHPESGDYLVVDKKTYDNYFRYRVVKGVLKAIDFSHGFRVKLKKSQIGYRTVAGHAGIILEDDEIYQNVEYYERNS